MIYKNYIIWVVFVLIVSGKVYSFNVNDGKIVSFKKEVDILNHNKVKIFRNARYRAKTRTNIRLRSIKEINRYVNSFKYSGEKRRDDIWLTPDDFFSNKKETRDCEDYAIAKKAMICFSFKKETRIIIGFYKNRCHAVLAVQIKNRWVILDNLSNSIVSDSEYQNFVPIWALDDNYFYLY